MKQDIVIADIIGECAIAAGCQTFLHGSVTEIETTLIEMTKLQPYDANVKKYTLIALFHDFPEQYGDDYLKVKLPVIIIATLTDPNYKATKRYDVNFKPILYPLYKKFKEQLVKHKNIVAMDADSIKHTKWDRLYWGTKQAGSSLTDCVDAIEMENTELLFSQFCLKH